MAIVTNNLNIFKDNLTTDEANTSEYGSGFSAGGYINADTFNTALHSATVINKALIQALTNNKIFSTAFTVNETISYDTLVTLFTTALPMIVPNVAKIAKEVEYALTISLNGSNNVFDGSSSKSISFYAPTTAGTKDYVLTSNGSGAPSWKAASSGGASVEIIDLTSVS